MRFAADVAAGTPSDTKAQRKQQQEGQRGTTENRSSPKTPQSRQPSAGTAAERSTAHKGAPPDSNACTPVSRAEPPAGGAEGDASWFDPLNPDKVSRYEIIYGSSLQGEQPSQLLLRPTVQLRCLRFSAYCSLLAGDPS